MQFQIWVSILVSATHEVKTASPKLEFNTTQLASVLNPNPVKNFQKHLAQTTSLTLWEEIHLLWKLGLLKCLESPSCTSTKVLSFYTRRNFEDHSEFNLDFLISSWYFYFSAPKHLEGLNMFNNSTIRRTPFKNVDPNQFLSCFL